MKKIKVKFDTLTPIWSGDAWGDNKEIRPSSLMGSLRFWFEVICYFSEITKKENYKDGKLQDNLDEKKFREKSLHNGSDFQGVNKTLEKFKISLPSRIFGCTGWKGWVRIKEILKESKCNNYEYYLGKLELKELTYNRNGKNKIPTWYFNKGFYGTFQVIFEVEENILNPIFYPLLNFMDQYGFWGGKWNIGYGRLTVEDVEIKESKDFIVNTEWRSEELKFGTLDKNLSDKKFSDIVESKSSFEELEEKKKKLMYLGNQNKTSYVKGIIRELIFKKSNERKIHKYKFNDVNLRHDLFGTIQNGIEGTKIIPWVYEEKGENEKDGLQFKGGFISVAGILNLGGKK